MSCSASRSPAADALAALNLGREEFCERLRQRTASNQVVYGELPACELADDHGGRRANHRGNDSGKPTPIGELRIEQRVVFVQLFAEPVGNHFKTGSQSRRIELDAGVPAKNPVALIPPCRIGISGPFCLNRY
jgi:hypothetical protein